MGGGLKSESQKSFGLLDKYGFHIGLFLLVVLVACLRMSLLDLPLERDEGEYAYAGQMILDGSLPYAEVYNMKLPGIYFAYAGIEALFGHTHQAVHIGLACVNILTIILLFFLGRNLIDPLAGLIASACFAVLCLDPVLQGIFANSEHFVILPVIGGMILMLHALKKNRPAVYFISGLLFGVGVLMKQHGAFFSLFALLYLLVTELKAGSSFSNVVVRGLLFSAGTAVPYGCVSLFFWSAGIFDKFWFWTVQYASRYTAQVPLGLGWLMLKETLRDMFRSSPFIWLLAGIGLSAPAWSRHARKHDFFTHGLFFFSLLSVMPGLYFRRHYFLLIVPAVSLLFGMAVSTARNEMPKVNRKSLLAYLPILISALVLTGSLYKHGSFMLGKTPEQLSRSINGLNPFPESIEIGKFIRANSGENDRIAVIGSEPQIYFYSGRRSATSYIYMYPLMELHEFALDMQKDMVREIETNDPKFLVFVHVDASWAIQPGSNTMLLSWLNDYYHARHYRPVGIIDIARYETKYYWAPNLKWPPESQQWIVVFRKTGNSPPLRSAAQ